MRHLIFIQPSARFSKGPNFNLTCTALPLATVPQAQERGVEPHLPVLSPLWLLVTLWGLALSVLAEIFDKKSHPADEKPV